MRVAVDVCIGARGIQLLRDAGHDVVVEAEHGESDRSWFDRALAAGVEVVISPDSDLEILCHDHRVRYIKTRVESGVENAQRAVYRMQSWVRPNGTARGLR